MRILYLHQYFVTPEMAGGTRSFEMATRLVRAGHEVHMITSDQQAEAGPAWRTTVEDGVVVHWARVRYSNYMGVRRRILAFLQFAVRSTTRATRLGGDVVLATSTPLTIAVPALVAATVRRRPFVFEVRDLWPAVPIAIGTLRNPVAIRLARALERLAYRRAAHVVALAPGMREDVVATGVPPEKVSVIPNGCDEPALRAADPDDVRSSHDWLGDRPLVLFAGTLGRVNGVSYLARLAAATRAIAPEVRFVVIGDGAERPAVTELARELGVLDDTFFVLGPLPKSQVAAWLVACDLSVALFAGPPVVWKDAVQNKFFDAVAAGKPVVMNFHGWQTDLALEAGIGAVLDAEDTAVAAVELVRVLRDHEWRAGVPDRAQRLALGPFSRDHLAARLEQVLHAAHEGRPPALPDVPAFSARTSA